MDDPDTIETECILGLDLGQASDPSALTVTERRVPVFEQAGRYHEPEKGDARYAVRWIKRFDLGTAFPEIVRQVAAVQRAPETGPNPDLVMDATGMGAPVVDLFQEEGLRPVEIVFTSGNSVTSEGRRYKVPKKDLATTVQTLLQGGRLTIAKDLSGASQLVREMKTFRVKIADSGHARFEHATEAESDDVLLSLACGLWWGERDQEVPFHFVQVATPEEEEEAEVTE